MHTLLRHSDRWSSDLLNAVSPILPLLTDDSVTEIEVFDYDHVRAKGRKWKGHRLCEGVAWTTPALLKTACSSIAEVVERSVYEEDPIFDGRLPGGERINIVVAPVAPSNPYITIRKFPREPMTLEKLLGYGSLSDEVADMLKGLIALKKNIIVAGGTESGKTSLLNALSLLVDPSEKIVTIEDARELQIQSPIWQALETLKPWKNTVREVTIGDLVKNSLRMSPDRIIVGEVRAEEALFLLRAFSTGHRGGLGTVHSDGAPDCLCQLQLLASLANVGGANPHSIASLVARAVDIVVYVKKIDEDGSRKITQIIEIERPNGVVAKGNEVHYRYRALAQFKFTGYGGMDENGFPEVRGRWEYPHCPSPFLIRSIRAKNMDPVAHSKIHWPQASLESGDEVATY